MQARWDLCGIESNAEVIEHANGPNAIGRFDFDCSITPGPEFVSKEGVKIR